jgi:hypothetical protein
MKGKGGLCAKELAWELGHHRNFVHAMRAHGFTGDTVAEALEWIAENGFVIRKGKAMMKARADGHKKAQEAQE